MTDSTMRPGGRVKRTIYYGPPLECRPLLDACERVLQPQKGHREFPITDDMRAAAVASIVASCHAVIAHTERWGPPMKATEPNVMPGSTWECVAWIHRGHAERVLRVAIKPALNFTALRRALNAWRKYGL
jgi:hypothetical protein